MANRMAPSEKMMEISLGLLLVLVSNVHGSTDVKGGQSVQIGIRLRLSGSSNQGQGTIEGKVIKNKTYVVVW